MSRHCATIMIERYPSRPCQSGLDWLGRRRSLPRAWSDCPDGSWLLWAAEGAGVVVPREWTARVIVAPACERACAALDRAGVPHDLAQHVDALMSATAETAGDVLLAADRAADLAADRAGDWAAAWAADMPGDWAFTWAAAWAFAWAAARAADWGSACGTSRAADSAAHRAANSAADSAASRATELSRIADEVRILWPEPPAELAFLAEVTA